MRARAIAAVAIGVALVAGCTDTSAPPEEDAPATPPRDEERPADGVTPGPDTAEEAPDDDGRALAQAGVSAGHEDAVDVGIEVLEDGGNAVDAAVATAFAISVVEPFASGIGGGGAALVLPLDDEPVAYDYREVVGVDGDIPASGTGVPGFVAGMAELHATHGTLPWGDLLAPAVDLARSATTSDLLAERLAGDAGVLPVEQLPHLYPDGAPLGEGDELVQEDLASTLELVADDGATAVTTGDLADSLAEAIDGLDRDTLAGYEVARGTPPVGTFGDLEVVGAAPPLPGTTLIQQLQLAEAAGIADLAPGSADVLHLLASASRVARWHQAWLLGDPAGVEVPVATLVDPARNADLAAELTLEAVPAIDLDEPPDSAPNTTHVTVVDADGTLVSMTNTLTNFWGARTYHRGFFLNDQLRRFELGRGDANAPAPGRRSVTYSLPAAVRDGEGRPVLGLGSPGGARIANVLSSVLVRWGLHDATLQEAVDAPRWHRVGTTLQLEDADEELRADLLGRGWSDIEEPTSRLHFGSVQALEVDHDTGEVHGATDGRRTAAHRIVEADELARR